MAIQSRQKHGARAADRGLWKVGDLAERTGLSVRALHHYDALGLLTPSHRTPSGHRLYTASDVAKLQQIKSLRSLGFSLEQVRECLTRSEFAPHRVLRLHIARLQAQIELQQRLCVRLEALATALGSGAPASTEQLLQAIEEITMSEQQFTSEQLEEIQARAAQLGPAGLEKKQAEWAALIAEVRAEMDKGTDPASPAMQALARRWAGLVREFTGGNPAIAKVLNARYQQNPDAASRGAVDRAMFEYVGKALAAAKVDLG